MCIHTQCQGKLKVPFPPCASHGKLADSETIEQQRERVERANLATQRRAEEKALDEARIRERWEKNRRDQQENNRRA
jgi:hypothetical protein